MLMTRSLLSGASLLAIAALLPAHSALAHGFAGQRFFPATIATDDPFVSDELSAPTVSTIRNPGEGGGQEIDTSIDVSKRITPNFGLGFGETWQHFSNAPSGFGNLELNAKYQLLVNAPHEALLAVGVDAEVGGTGAKKVGADRFSTVTPALFFGKGMGDLPDSMKWLKPFAVTGSFGIGFPTRASTITDPDSGDVERHSNTFETGLAIEYNLQYLQSSVQDIGLPAPFNRMIPLVEFAFSTPFNRGQNGLATGTINPGVAWAGRYFQLTAEAIIPANNRSGRNVGGVFQIHFFLDDIFPRTIGRPIFQ
jgi:hypothetical protein